MGLFPTRFTVNSLMGWLGFKDSSDETINRYVLDLMYFGMKHFRLPQETMRIMPNVFSDDELRALRVPVLLLIGENEAIYDAAEALARASQLIPDFKGELVPGCKHDMCASQYRIVHKLIHDFLKDN